MVPSEVLQRLVLSLRPKSILLAYLAVSIAIVVVPAFYLWQSCVIDQEYLGESTNYYCGKGFAGVLIFWFIFTQPFMFFLLVPIIVGVSLTALRMFRWRFSALTVRDVIFLLVVMTVMSSILIMFGSILVSATDDQYRDKQCYNGNPPTELVPYCLKGTARANLSSALSVGEIALCVSSIALAALYRNYY